MGSSYDSAEVEEPSAAKKIVTGSAKAAVPPVAGMIADAIVPGAGTGVTIGTAMVISTIQEFSVPIMNARSRGFIKEVDGGFAELHEVDPSLDLTDPVVQERITSAVLLALPVAIRTRNAEKLFQLRNAVLNSAFPVAPDEDVIAVYMDMIDSLTPFHIRLLTYLTDPDVYYAMKGLQRPKQRFGYQWSRDPALTDEENKAAEQQLKDRSQQAYNEGLALFKDLFDAHSYSVGFCNAALQDLFARGFLNPDWQDRNPMRAWSVISITTEFVPTLVLSFAFEFLGFLKNPVIDLRAKSHNDQSHPQHKS